MVHLRRHLEQGQIRGHAQDLHHEPVHYGDRRGRWHAAADWTLVSLKWSDFAQATWAIAKKMDLTKATKIAWQTTNLGVTGDKGDISVDEIHLPGWVVPVVTGIKSAHPSASAAGRSRSLFVRLDHNGHPVPGSVMYNAAGRSIAVPQAVSNR